MIPGPTLKALRPAVATSLEKQIEWFSRMLAPPGSQNVVTYMYIPEEDKKVDACSPIRELGTAATLAALSSTYGRPDFDTAVASILNKYEGMLVREKSPESEGPATAEGLGGTATEPELSETLLPFAFLDPDALGEPSTIAHNAMLLLALLNYEHYPDEGRKEGMLSELAHGIVRQQKKTGRFKIHFLPKDLPDSGWELYSGESELALTKTYGRLGDWRLLHSASRAFTAYTAQQTTQRVRKCSTLFFANWQCQAGHALLQHTTSSDKVEGILRTMCALQDEVVHVYGLFAAAASSQETVSVVELACGLEGLLHTYAALLTHDSDENKERMSAYEAAIVDGVQFLLEVQSRGADDGVSEAAEGGFGFSTADTRQRIDVTGHVTNAFLLLMELLA